MGLGSQNCWLMDSEEIWVRFFRGEAVEVSGSWNPSIYQGFKNIPPGAGFSSINSIKMKYTRTLTACTLKIGLLYLLSQKERK